MRPSPRSRTIDKKNEDTDKMSRNASYDERSPESRQRSKIEEWKKKVHILKSEIDNEQKQKDVNVSEFLQMSQKADPDQITILKNIFEKRNFTHGVKIQKAQVQLEKYLRKIEEAEAVVGRSSFYSASSSFDSTSVKPEAETENQKRFKSSRSNENMYSNGGSGGGGGGGGGSGGGGGVVWESGSGSGGSKSSSLQRGLRLEDGVDIASPRNLHDGIPLERPLQAFTYHDKSGLNNNNGVTPNNNNGSNFKNNSLNDTSLSSSTSSPSSFELSVAVSLTMREISETRQLHDKQLQELRQQQDKVRKELEDLRQFSAAEMKNANYRYQRLEDQLNDQVDIHHNELANLKQEISVLAMKEDMRILDFRSKERSRDLHEQLEACQQKVEKMEKTQENFMTHPENLQGIVLPKLINFVLGLIQIGILIVNAASSILSSRWRLLLTSIFVIALVIYRMQSQ